MSSASTVTAPNGNNSTNHAATSASLGNGVTRNTMRSSNQAKNNDGSRKQSPVDSASRYVSSGSLRTSLPRVLLELVMVKDDTPCRTQVLVDARMLTPCTSASRPAAPKAWTSGTNPLTQRGTSSPQSNGVAASSKSTSTKSNVQKESGISDKHAHDRLLYVLGASIVRQMYLMLSDGLIGIRDSLS